MADTVYLVGAEDVRAAGNAIRAAAQDIQQAASTLESSLDRHRQFMDDWLQRFVEVLEQHREGSSGK